MDLDFDVILSEADNSDLVKIIEDRLPHAPQFKDLLESQLNNAKNMDPRRRRWDKQMISLCLHLWAR